jgi:hypothetical protein
MATSYKYFTFPPCCGILANTNRLVDLFDYGVFG